MNVARTEPVATPAGHADTASTAPAATPEPGPVDDHARLLTVTAAATATGMKPTTLRRRIERGTLPCVRKDGRVLVPWTELERAGLVARTSPDPEAVAAHASTELVAVTRALETARAEASGLRQELAAMQPAYHQAVAERQTAVAQLAERTEAGWLRRVRLAAARRPAARVPVASPATRPPSNPPSTTPQVVTPAGRARDHRAF